MNDSARRTGRARAAVFVAFTVLAAVFVRAAWMSDDAYITLRVLDNALHGAGLRWNVLERVQAYTHPLWLLFLALPYAITRETLWTIGLVGVGTTLVAIGLGCRRLLRIATPEKAVFFLAVCALSRSVVSYASSGLENPLSLLLFVLLLERCAGAPRPRTTVLLAALIALTRIDLLLVAAPLVFVELRRVPLRTACTALVVGSLPLLGWETFSLVYYGALVPNTAFAKLGAGIDHLVLARQGLRYCSALLRWDPLGATVLVVGLVVGAFAGARALVVGLVAYLGYIVWIGGDFMCGRFYSVPIALAALTLAGTSWPKRAWLALGATPILLALAVEGGPWTWLTARDRPTHYAGIIDERVFYSPHTGLLDPARPDDVRLQMFARAGLDARNFGVYVNGCIGMVGYYAGRGLEVIDPMGLADPLLARLPIDDAVHFRIGHFARWIPEGYIETVRDGVNKIEDGDLSRYWGALELVTRGPIWSGARWRAIWALSTGKLDGLRDAYVARRRERVSREASGSTAP